jgi:6-phosphofructokinase 1
MAAVQNGKTEAIPLKKVAGKLKTVPLDDPLIVKGRSIGVSFGDKN